MLNTSNKHQIILLETFSRLYTAKTSVFMKSPSPTPLKISNPKIEYHSTEKYYTKVQKQKAFNPSKQTDSPKALKLSLFRKFKNGEKTQVNFREEKVLPTFNNLVS